MFTSRKTLLEKRAAALWACVGLMGVVGGGYVVGCGGSSTSGASAIGNDGGTVTGGSGRVEVRFPEGSVEKAGSVQVSEARVAADPAQVPGTAFRISSSATPKGSVELAIAYGGTTLPEGATPEQLAIYEIAADGLAHRLISQVDREAGKVRAWIDGFGTFEVRRDNPFAGVYMGSCVGPNSEACGDWHALVGREGRVHLQIGDATPVDARIDSAGLVGGPIGRTAGESAISGKIQPALDGASFEASLLHLGRHVTLRGRASGLSVTLQPIEAETAEENRSIYRISPTLTTSNGPTSPPGPVMPKIKVEATIQGVDGADKCLKNTLYQWSATLLHDPEDRQETYRPKRTFDMSIPAENTASQKWSPKFGSQILGGKFSITVQVTAEGLSLPATSSLDLYIVGSNPTPGDVETAIKSQADSVFNGFDPKLISKLSNAVIGISKVESFGGKQFDDELTRKVKERANAKIGQPLWSSDGLGGVGILQITNKGEAKKPIPPTLSEVWNWRANVQGGVKLFRDAKWTEAENRRKNRMDFPTTHRNEWKKLTDVYIKNHREVSKDLKISIKEWDYDMRVRNAIRHFNGTPSVYDNVFGGNFIVLEYTLETESERDKDTGLPILKLQNGQAYWRTVTAEERRKLYTDAKLKEERYYLESSLNYVNHVVNAKSL